tara:strand:+ start:204 stop:335 length:132 start_codon:yes stop_codon:yes gene_type:complete
MQEKKERLKRLNQALEEVIAISGSPDLIESLMKAIEEERKDMT